MMWSLLLPGLAAAAFWAASKQRKHMTAFAARAVNTEAEIIRLETAMPGQEMKRRAGTVSKTFPVFRFTDNQQRVCESRSCTSYPFDKLTVGQTMTILYDPKDPRDVRIGMSSDKSLFYFLTGLGVVFVGLSIYELFS